MKQDIQVVIQDQTIQVVIEGSSGGMSSSYINSLMPGVTTVKQALDFIAERMNGQWVDSNVWNDSDIWKMQHQQP